MNVTSMKVDERRDVIIDFDNDHQLIFTTYSLGTLSEEIDLDQVILYNLLMKKSRLKRRAPKLKIIAARCSCRVRTNGNTGRDCRMESLGDYYSQDKFAQYWQAACDYLQSEATGPQVFEDDVRYASKLIAKGNVCLERLHQRMVPGVGEASPGGGAS